MRRPLNQGRNDMEELQDIEEKAQAIARDPWATPRERDLAAMVALLAWHVKETRSKE